MSEERPGRRLRQQIRAERIAAVRPAALPLLTLAAVCAVITGLSARYGSASAGWFFAGFSLAGWMATAWWAIGTISGTTNRAMGLDAEGWTRDELRKLHRGGWRAVHGIPMERGGDVDHVVLGPAGAFAVETKWCQLWADRGWPVEHLSRGADQAAAGARKARSWLRSLGVVTPVTPVVVAWGRGTVPADAAGDVHVMHGRDLQQWLESRDPGALSSEQVVDLAARLEGEAARWDGEHRRREPQPSLLLRIGPVAFLSRVGQGLAAGVGGVVAFGLALEPLDRLLPWHAAFAVVLGSVTVLGVGSYRVERVRHVGAGLLTAAAFMVLLLGGSYAGYYLAGS